MILSSGSQRTISDAHRWFIIALLFAASLINYLDRATLSVAIPLISKDFALGPTSKGVLLSSFFWSYALMQVPMGWCVDRLNLRWVYAGAFALWSIACGLTGLAQSVLSLVVLRIALGIGESIYLPGGSKIVSVLFVPQDRGLPSAVFDSGSRLGLAVGTPLAALLMVHYGWRNMFLIVSFSSLLWLVPWVLTFPSSLSREKTNLAVEPKSGGHRRPRMITFNRNLLGLCIGFFCFGYYWYFLVTWLLDYLVEARHLTVLTAGVFASFPYLVFGVSTLLGGWMGDRLVRRGWNETRTRKGIVTGAFLTGFFLIPAAMAGNINVVIGYLAAASLVGFGGSNLLVILQGCAPPEEVGIWAGVMNSVGNLAGIVAPLVTGVLINRTGSYLPAFVLAPVVLGMGLLAYWFVVGEVNPSSRPLV